MTTSEPTQFRIVTVCTGNICRSPAAELLLKYGFNRMGAAAAGVEVSSAGTRALAGQPVHGPMAQLLSGADVDPSSFRARQVTEQIVSEADLILAMAAEHRSALVELSPLALRKSFTVGELAGIVSGLSAAQLEQVGAPGTVAGRLTALVALAATQRGGLQLEELDVVDPYRLPEEVYRKSLGQVHGYLGSILRVLA